MHKIVKTEKGYDITLTRGDSLNLLLELERDGEPYVPDPMAVIRFAMKAKYKDPDTDVALVKNIPPDTLLLAIEPEDTKGLVMGKSYVYDIQLTDEYGYVDTFIEGRFIVGEEVL